MTWRTKKNMEEYKEVKLRDTGCKNETRKELAEDRVK
jgi:hypothetical protein